MGANDVERKRPLFDMVTGSGALDGLAPVEPTFSVFVELKARVRLQDTGVYRRTPIQRVYR